MIDSDLSKLEQNCESLALMYSRDDNIVPVQHAEKFDRNLSEADIIIYESKDGHFQAEEFPELIEQINGDLKNGRAGF